MARNMSFDRYADDIADTLNGEPGIELGDVLTGVIGLARIVATQQALINNLRKDNDAAETAVKEIKGAVVNLEKAMINFNEFSEMIIEQLKKEE